MAGLVPAIHVFARPRKEIVDARHKAGHDGIAESEESITCRISRFALRQGEWQRDTAWLRRAMS
jgi:hypothetical protein